ncbi:hypothetical protein AAMO2058_001320400 [Amorphochlora amoebiformis]
MFPSDHSDTHDMTSVGTSSWTNASDTTEYKLGKFIFIPPGMLQMGQEIGRGVGGIALKASYNGRLVVVKVSRGVTDVTEELIAQLSIPKHRNLLDFIGLTSIGHEIGLVSPFIELGSLDKLHSTFDMGEKHFFMQISYDIASGLNHLHKNRIVQRDIACRNILMRKDHSIVIADWGLARKLQSNGSYSGNKSRISWPWSAPESLESHTFTPKSDMWMFGVTMWELLSRGSEPYDYTKKDAWLAKDQIKRGELLLADLKEYARDPVCVELMRDCVQHDPLKRPDAKK